MCKVTLRKRKGEISRVAILQIPVAFLQKQVLRNKRGVEPNSSSSLQKQPISSGETGNIYTKFTFPADTNSWTQENMQIYRRA